ncbi:hypothetical protein M422DRAFT_780088 [Sphaerobolus stellatus SS14]|uniref:F-box domain-containing protein n=1 Tax=Sphaerobolus stellatus (strain SS14) TaxID=990650 RepID=A0A0C9V5D7_SPHS4|nr:hypothetical protein M422DRAFT_780088 [Sphaerobolus stellatus SS14]
MPKNQTLGPCWANLPIELVWRILEFAATSTPTAATLLRVSRAFFDMFVPSVYHTVAIESFSQLKRFRMACMESPRKLRYQNTVKRVCLAPILGIFTEQSRHHIAEARRRWMRLPLLEHLSLPNLLFLDTFASLESVTHLLVAYEVSFESLLRNKTQLHSLTHLTLPHSNTLYVLVRDSDPNYSWHFPNLTHIAIPINGITKPYLIRGQQLLLSKITTGSPNLRSIALMPFYFAGPNEFISVEALDRAEVLDRLHIEANDPRYVVIPDMISTEALSEIWSTGDTTIWETTEKLQSQL